MATRKTTTAGLLFWTPAPVRSSPTSSVLSDDVWEDEEDQEDEFASQMDENGIIGLTDALEDIQLEDGNMECNPAWCPGPLTPEQAGLTGCEVDAPSEEHLSQSQSPEEDAQRLFPLGDGLLREWGEDEQMLENRLKHIPKKEVDLDMMKDEKDGEEKSKRSDRKKYGHVKGSTESYSSKEGGSGSVQPPPTEPAGAPNHHCPLYQSSLIYSETLPDMSVTESLPESRSSLRSHKSSPQCQETCQTGERKGPQPATAPSSEPVMADQRCGVSRGSPESNKCPTSSLRKTRQPSSEASMSRSLSTDRAGCLSTRPDRATTRPADSDQSRKRSLSYRTPNFSKVEPKVHFPKNGYKPPKSRHSSKRQSLSPEPPLVFKSPADIVKEVLLNTPDGPPAPSDWNESSTRALKSTVPQEFRCRQQAATLLEQLQEEYDKLLTKYAEKENTIDRMRLEAKVNLYSDPPKPGPSVQSALNKEPSKFLMLEFPQAQRAELHSASFYPCGHSTPLRGSSTRSSSSASLSSSRSPGPHVAHRLARILYSQADKFLQQLQTFEDFIKNKKLKAFEQMKGLSQLFQGLESLERGYLLARDEHKLLQKQGREISHFDPERELEGLIFQCGLRMDELEEQVDQMVQEQLTRPPSPPLQPNASPLTSEGARCPCLPQHSGVKKKWSRRENKDLFSHTVLLPVDAGVEAVAQLSTASEENDDDNDSDDDGGTSDNLNQDSCYLKPLNGNHGCVEQDFATPATDHQSFKEPPELLSCGLRERTSMEPEHKGKERHILENDTMAAPESLPPSKQQACSSNMSSHRDCTPLPSHPPKSSSRLEVGQSHSSAGVITATESWSSKLPTESRRMPSQDGVVSPEMDSGFVGSDSSRLTPAAAPSPRHQRASKRSSVSQGGNSGIPQTSRASAPSPSSLLSPRRLCTRPGENLHRRPDKLRRPRERSRTASCSPLHRFSQTAQTRVNVGTSALESDTTHSVSENGQTDQFAESINSLPSSCLSSSPVAQYYHDDSLKALSSHQVANCGEAIQSLQAEVTKLRDRIESSLRTTKPLSAMEASPSPPHNGTHHNSSTPRIRCGERRSDAIGGGTHRWMFDEAEEEEELRPTARKNSSSAALGKKTQAHISKTSELQDSHRRRQVSRCTQTCAAEPDSQRSCTSSSCRRRTHPRQDGDVCVQVTAGEPDGGRGGVPPCSACSPRHRGPSERPADDINWQTHSSSSSHSCHCPLCGRSELNGGTEPDRPRDPDTRKHPPHKPAQSPGGALRSGYFAAAAPPTLCVPVCPPPLLLYSHPQTLYVPPSNSTGTSSGVKGYRDLKGRPKHSLSTTKQRSLDSSLNRAIRAARHMKHTSRHMARSLATGLH